jgi:cell division control protein 24
MRKWAIGLETQRRENGPRSSMSPDAVPVEFEWTRDQASMLENPYLQGQEEDEDDDYDGPATAPSQFPMPGSGIMPRTSSSSNLRQRSATGESAQSLAGIARAPPPRFPLPPPPAPLSLQTQNSSGLISPGSRGGDSYFSPVVESPASSRASTTSGVFAPPAGYPFPKSGTQPVWDDTAHRYNAPSTPRAPSRDGSSPNIYAMNGRNPRGPSLPAMTNPQTILQQQRSRSYSTPDINGPGIPRQRQPSQGNVPAVPGIPQHLHHPAHDANVPRSHTGSPRTDLPIRTQTQSPGAQRERMHQHSGSLSSGIYQPPYSRGNTPGPGPPGGNTLRVDSAAANSRTVSPAPGTALMTPQTAPSSGGSDMPLPTQLKVRVNCDSGNYVTLVVAFNITYQSLIDRIDAKLARFTASSIGKGNLKLRYRDEDGDFVTIQSDDDIQIAFMDYREGLRNMYSGGVGEIELFCVGDTS